MQAAIVASRGAVAPGGQAPAATAQGRGAHPGTRASHVEAAISLARGGGAAGTARAVVPGPKRAASTVLRREAARPAPRAIPRAPGATAPGRSRGVVQRAAGLGKAALEILFWPMMTSWPSDGSPRAVFKARLRGGAANVGGYVAHLDDPIIDQIVDENVPADEPLPLPPVERVQIRDSQNHLSGFTRGSVHKKSPANAVNVRVRIGGNVVSEKPAGAESRLMSDAAILQQMQLPDGGTSSEVAETTNDGEVAVLAGALQVIARHFGKPSTATSNQRVEVSVYGAWGPCNGCKRRLARFARLCGQFAEQVMRGGTRATLTLTSGYLNAAQDMGYGGGMYGWPGDDEETGSDPPYRHTIEVEVTGADA